MLEVCLAIWVELQLFPVVKALNKSEGRGWGGPSQNKLTAPVKAESLESAR